MTRRENMRRMLKARNAKTGVRVVNSRGRTRDVWLGKRQIVLVLVMLLICMGSGIGYVWSNFERTQIGNTVAELRGEEMRLKEINRKLRLEIATLKSPQHLETLAVDKLGLQRPAPHQIVIVP